jgi:hypothetical protein
MIDINQLIDHTPLDWDWPPQLTSVAMARKRLQAAGFARGHVDKLIGTRAIRCQWDGQQFSVSTVDVERFCEAARHHVEG